MLEEQLTASEQIPLENFPENAEVNTWNGVLALGFVSPVKYQKLGRGHVTSTESNNLHYN